MMSTNEQAKNYTKYELTGKCEMYYVEEDQWEDDQPSLNTPKQGVALCNFRNKCLYAFGGLNQQSKGTQVAEIERLNLDGEASENEWVEIYIKVKEGFGPFGFALALPINDDSILIIGGQDHVGQLSNVFLYNHEQDIFTNQEHSLAEKDHFYQPGGPQYCALFDKLYILGVNNTHCYDMKA